MQSFYSYQTIVSLLLLSVSLFFGLSTDASPIDLPTSKGNLSVVRGKSPGEYPRLVVKLRAQKASVRSTKEKVRQPFFSVLGRIMTVNNEAIQVFEYSSPVTTQSDVERVSPDGKSIGATKPSWMSTPHFFKSDKLVVIYIGDDQAILEILQAVLGKQFAGG